jgi:hypothetical protein
MLEQSPCACRICKVLTQLRVPGVLKWAQDTAAERRKYLGFVSLLGRRVRLQRAPSLRNQLDQRLWNACFCSVLFLSRREDCVAAGPAGRDLGSWRCLGRESQDLVGPSRLSAITPALTPHISSNPMYSFST